MVTFTEEILNGKFHFLCRINKKKMSQKGEEEETRRCRDEKQQHQSDYDMLCNQLLSAMNELETLRRRHKEVLNQCEMAAQEKDYFKKQYKGTTLEGFYFSFRSCVQCHCVLCHWFLSQRPENIRKPLVF